MVATFEQTPCDPKTLTRAARDFADVRPEFAAEAGLAALHWLVEGPRLRDHERRRVGRLHGDDEGGGAGRARRGSAGLNQDVRTGETFGEHFVTRTLGRVLGL